MLGFGLSSAVEGFSIVVDASRPCSNGFTSGMLGVDVWGARYAGSTSSSRSTRTTIVEDCGRKAQHWSRDKAHDIQRSLSIDVVGAMPAYDELKC